tara:strand:- start:2157 stop:2429 length:273 start_codon:yes stop_codon:yes gene_type:complete
MNVLCSGLESEERIDLLLQLTSIKSEDKIKALKYHLVTGRPKSVAANINGVDPSNFQKTLDDLNVVASIIEDIKVIDCCIRIKTNWWLVK